MARSLKRVLVLEDDNALNPVLTRVIRSVAPGATVDWVTSVSAAKFALLAANAKGDPAYDLIVADVFLEGGQTGIDFWQACQVDFPDVPLVIISSMKTDQFLNAVGPNAIVPPFIEKPLRIGECRQIFSSLLSYGATHRSAA